jgi:hypothetical protein
MIGDVRTSAASEGLDNINRPPFVVDPNSGEVAVNFDAQVSLLYRFMILRAKCQKK